MHFATKDGIFKTCSDGAVRMILGEPRQCRCGRMVAFLVNRNGKTLCIDCDRKTLDEIQPTH